MADNVTLNAGTGGDVVRTLDRSGVETQIVCIDLNPAGAETLMAGSMPVTIAADMTVIGKAAHDSAVSGNPVLVGMEARGTAVPTPVASGDVVRPTADRLGRQLIAKPPSVSYASTDTTPVTTATTTTVIAAPSAGNHLKIHRIWVSNQGTTACLVSWKPAGGTQMYHAYLAQGGAISLALDGQWELATATALQMVTSAAGSIHYTVSYETMAD